MNVLRKSRPLTLFCALAALALVGILAAYRTIAADEFTVTTTLKVDNGKFTLTRNVANYTPDQSGTAADYGIAHSTNTATNAIYVANVSTPYYAFFRNLNTNAGGDIFVTLTIQLRPEDVALLPLQTTNVTHYTTNAAGSDFEYWINHE